jgi:transcriptional regulator with GAF, ATPase, and Fis domain
MCPAARRPPVMRAPHELTRLRAVHAEQAAERLRSAVTEASGDVAGAARALGVTRVLVHRWITAWGLRAWLTEAYPRGERARAGRMKGRAGRSTGA